MSSTGSLIDINGTLFVVKIRPVFHADRGGMIAKALRVHFVPRGIKREKNGL